ncbi:MAG: dihydroorotate dehydrogenase electron transfer subunit [Treponema sp.]|jgi:NAD(P)H-flavin reductase|nr:dihydroorotate dehydrogenase electron transfer subunit [Treponema sp.]
MKQIMDTDFLGANCAKKEYLLCECVNRSIVNDEITALEFAWPGPEPVSGQFFMVRLQRTAVFLGRPLSVAGFQPTSPGKPGTLRFLMAVRGQGTKELAEIGIGERAFLTGPLGRGWELAAGTSPNDNSLPGGKLFKRSFALISGGIGIAPLAFFAREIQDRQDAQSCYDFYAGFKGRSFGLEGLNPGSLVISSEDGSEGKKGRIPDFFTPDFYDAVFACGPEPMLKTVAEKCKAASVSCYISMERRMACGTGACLGCAIKTVNGNKRCCADGPVFNAEEIIFDE